jgi:hypothetical protein
MSNARTKDFGMYNGAIEFVEVNEFNEHKIFTKSKNKMKHLTPKKKKRKK